MWLPEGRFLIGDVEYEELSRMWEIELSPPSCSIKGRLRKHLIFWRAELNASSTVLNTIESGYVLPLKSEPTEYHRELYILYFYKDSPPSGTLLAS